MRTTADDRDTVVIHAHVGQVMPASKPADRHNEGKPRVSFFLEAPRALAGTVKVFEAGEIEYGRGNWQKGLPWTSVMDSLLRHEIAFLNGEDLDKKSGLPHVDHMVCNALFLAEYFRTHKEMDDRV